ncbi:MAG: P-II family nitrogen regulator [Clostridiales bacterium]|jgi:nitrogen regulatory protein PII|nr:P-II family nitrogen regulator [Clostridiales bacterium]
MKKVRIGVINIDTLFFTIVNRGKANSVLRKAKECGASAGTILLGEGTIQSKLLDILGMTETRKEILMIPASGELDANLHEILSDTFKFSKRNKGIAFSVPFRRWTAEASEQEHNISLEDDRFTYCCIFTIVDKGRSRDCITAARAAGARGGTVIRGHGAGVPADSYYPLAIEPQKDTIIVITSKEKAATIREKIFSDLELDKPGNGIIFTLPVSNTSGLYERRTEERKGGTS